MAIHEQNYVRYEGALRERGAWWVIARASLRVYWSFLRTKLTLLFVSLGPVIFAVLVFLEFSFRQSQLGKMGGGGAAPGSGPLLFYMHAQTVALALVLAAGGCGVIADDLRYKTFQLYFSKPLTRVDYAFGKAMSLFLLGGLVTIVPTVLLGGRRVAFFAQTAHASVVAKQTGMGLLFMMGITAMCAALVSGLSSLTERTGYVVLAWLGLCAVPLLVQIIVGIAAPEGSDVGYLMSLNGNLHLLAKWALDGADVKLILSSAQTAGEAPKTSTLFNLLPLLILLGAGGGGAGLLWRRISKLEGVA